MVGVNDASDGKGFPGRDIGMAKNEGLHLAFDVICPNVKLVHMSDGDTYRSGSQVNALIRLMHTQHPDIVTFQQMTTTRTLPEQISKEMSATKRFATMMKYYVSTLASSFSYYSRNSQTMSLGGSQIALSRKAYQKHEYPFGAMNSDFAFSPLVMNDSELKVIRGDRPDLAIYLVNRGREESIDGSNLGRERYGSSLQKVRKDLDEDSRQRAYTEVMIASEYMSSQETKLFYGRIKNEMKQKIHHEREAFLRRATVVFQQIEKYFHETDRSSIKDLRKQFHPIAQGFFADNPLLLPTLIELFKKQKIIKTDEMLSFLKHYLPEYFAPIPQDKYQDDRKLVAYVEANTHLPPGYTVRDALHFVLANAAMLAHEQNKAQVARRQ